MGLIYLSQLPQLVSQLDAYMFRLETFDVYADDDELIAKWQSGEDISELISSCEWSQVLYRKTQEGVSCSRVHVIPDELNDYLRFEIFGYYPVSSGLGEKIFILPQSLLDPRKCPLAEAKQDFLLLDDRLYYHTYNKDLLLEHTEEIESQDLIGQALIEMDELISSAIPLHQYIKG